MSKKLYFIFILPIFFVFCFVGINFSKPVKAEQNDIESFLKSYKEMISEDDFLDNYQEKLLDYDDVLSYDNQNMVEAEILEDKLNIFVEQKSNNVASVLSINSSKNQYVLKSDMGEFGLENILLEDEKVFVSVDEVASKLDYEVLYDEEEIKIKNPYETKRIIVYSQKSLNTQNASKATTLFNGMQIFQYETEKATKSAYNYYKNLKDVSNVCLDSVVTTLENSFAPLGLNDSFSYSTWGAEAMNIEDYSNYLLSKSNEQDLKPVYVAVLDTGIDTDHPWFSGRIDFEHGKNFTSSKSSTSYEFEDSLSQGHGTHVSGIIVDLTLKNVQIIPIKVIGDNGYGYTSGIIAGMEYVNTLKDGGLNVLVMNMSLGSEISVGTSDYNLYKNKIESAYQKGILSVVAAGNGDKNQNAVDAETCCPANVETAITVSAISQSNSVYTHPKWSNYGELVDVSAPGGEIISAKAGGGKVSMSGTSMAAPHVSAAIAMLFSDPINNHTLSDVENILQTHVIDLGDVGKDIYFGYGLVNLEYAYTSLLENVVFSNTDSTCLEAFDLTLTNVNADAEIYYTTDGTTPTKTNGTKYTSPIHISSSITITAIAFVFENDDIKFLSRATRMSYYFSSIDTPEKYEILNGVLLKYKGSLEYLAVPSEVNGNQITEIGKDAFKQNTTLKNVTLAESITYIGEEAFSGCTSLKNIYAPGVIKLGSKAFYECIGLIKLNETNFKKLETIGQKAFYNCYNIQEILLPNVKILDFQAFCMGRAQISKLSILNLPSVLTIGEEAFVYCDSLNEVYLPNVITLSSDAFHSCSIKTISLPEVKYLGNYAFYQNTNLKAISIPKAEIISSYCFYNCALTEINAPNVSFVGKDAFYGNTQLLNVDLQSLKSVGESAFEKCSNLKTITTQNIQNVDAFAFYECQSLEEISLPAITHIGGGAFYGTALKKVALSPCLDFVGYSAFKNIDTTCEFFIYKNTIEDYLTENKLTYSYLDDEMSLFKYKIILNEVYITGYICSSEEVTIPSFLNGLKVTTICENAFSSCDKLKKINLCNLTKIEDNAFLGCENLTYVKANNLSYVGDNAFKNCLNLSYISLNNVTNVGNEAFFNCPKLLSVVLGKDIESIGSKAFAYLPQNEGIYEMVSSFVLYGMSGTVAESYVSQTNQQKDLTINSTITFVPDFYELTENDFLYDEKILTSSIEITSVNDFVVGNIIIPQQIVVDDKTLNITQIGAEAFDDCSFITNIILPETITKISNGAFKNCSALKSINLNYIEEVGNNAFEGCDSLKSVDAPKLEEISINCFLNCGNLVYVSIPNVKIIYAQAFKNCYSLKEVISPKLEQIYYAAFHSCFSLEKIDLNKVTYLGREVYEGYSTYEGYTFAYCKNLTDITLNNVKIIYSNSFLDSGIKNVVLGNSIAISEQKGFYVTYVFSKTCENFTTDMTIYGKSGTMAQTVAQQAKCEFVPLEEFSVNLPESLIVGKNQTQVLKAETNGYDVTYQWYQITNNYPLGKKLDGETKSYLGLNTDTIGTYKYFVKATNFDGTTKQSNTATVNVVQSYNLTTEEQGFGVVNPHCDYVYDTQTFLITPRIGYYVKEIKINSEDIDSEDLSSLKDGGEYVLENISEDITISAVFEIYKYNINVSSNNLGSVSVDNNNVAVAEWGTDKKITLSMNDGYCIRYIEVNGEKILITDEIISSKEFYVKNIKNDIEIYVCYDNKFEIKSLETENGTISDSKIVNLGEDYVVFMNPNTGYEISDVVVDGSSVSGEVLNNIKSTNSYTFSSVKTDHTIEVFYSLQTFKINYEISSGEGEVSFDKNIDSITYGDSRTIIIEPNDGYYVESVYVNGTKVKLSNDGTYLIENITSDLIVKINFVKPAEKNSALTTLIVVLCSGFVVVIGAMLVLLKISKVIKKK
ncbi:MAG: leucine-rich repeat protein [Clostridia bacterium]|nr:leucine-rich repeat protein [Clostridia bacterium]